MPPFIAPRHLVSDDSKKTKETKNTNFEITILASAKKAKLSFEELNLMTLNDFFDYIDIFIGEESGQVKQAEQEDIDNFYSLS